MDVAVLGSRVYFSGVVDVRLLHEAPSVTGSSFKVPGFLRLRRSKAFACFLRHRFGRMRGEDIEHGPSLEHNLKKA